MLRIETIAEVSYCCEVDGEDEQKIREYAKEHDCSLDEAVGNLMYQVELYKNSWETDFNTTTIESVEEVDDDG